jgi:glucosamine--fructose-6-phosphate aminotransferase (isomerizing)
MAGYIVSARVLPVCKGKSKAGSWYSVQPGLAGSVPYHFGISHPIALEGALKLKEITYAHCEGSFSSEFKHGPLSAVHLGYPVIFITAPGDEAMMINHGTK